MEVVMNIEDIKNELGYEHKKSGVSKRTGKWGYSAQIRVSGKLVHIGFFNKVAEAREAVRVKRGELGIIEKTANIPLLNYLESISMGDEVMSERKIANLFEVTRCEARKVISILKCNGHIRTIHGVGSFMDKPLTGQTR